MCSVLNFITVVSVIPLLLQSEKSTKKIQRKKGEQEKKGTQVRTPPPKKEAPLKKEEPSSDEEEEGTSPLHNVWSTSKEDMKKLYQFCKANAKNPETILDQSK